MENKEAIITSVVLTTLTRKCVACGVDGLISSRVHWSISPLLELIIRVLTEVPEESIDC